jgi:adenylate cyclase
MKEIERKFLVKSNDFIKASQSQNKIAQGYLNSNPERTVRVRIYGKEAFITIKGKSNESGTTRMELEYEIPTADAVELLKMCENGRINKTRYKIPFADHLFEVDVFHDDNEGLIIAEIELTHEEESFEKPDWLDVEITGDVRYYNSYISQKPYKNW